MLIIPLRSVPSQIVTVQLASQYTQINLKQKLYGLFMDVYVNNGLVVAGVICESFNLIVRSAYLGFIGDLGFIDNQATASSDVADPHYTGLGSRWSLAYLETTDLL